MVKVGFAKNLQSNIYPSFNALRYLATSSLFKYAAKLF